MHFFDSYPNVSTRPAVNILENEKGYRLEMAVPGFSKDDISVTVKENVLNIKAQAPSSNLAQGARVLRREFEPRTFERNFRLSEKVDQDSIHALVEQGVLVLAIGKMVPEKKVIEVA